MQRRAPRRADHMHYKEADDEYFAIVSSEMVKLFTQPGATDFPNTYRAFSGFSRVRRTSGLGVHDVRKRVHDVGGSCGSGASATSRYCTARLRSNKAVLLSVMSLLISALLSCPG